MVTILLSSPATVGSEGGAHGEGTNRERTHSRTNPLAREALQEAEKEKMVDTPTRVPEEGAA
jgi:hypothetical protein